MSAKIQVLKQFTLLSEEWVNSMTVKYGTFSEKHFAENLANEAFNYFNGLFNVLVFRTGASGQIEVLMELTSNPLQQLTVPHRTEPEGVKHCSFTVYIFKEGFFQVPTTVEPWCAYGTYSRTEKDKMQELNFYYVNVQ